MSRHTLSPMPAYKAVQAASLRRYRERIADLLSFQSTRTAMLEHGVVDLVAREIDLTARRRVLAVAS